MNTARCTSSIRTERVDPQAGQRRNEELARRALWADCERTPQTPPVVFHDEPITARSLWLRVMDYFDGR